MFSLHCFEFIEAVTGVYDLWLHRTHELYDCYPCEMFIKSIITELGAKTTAQTQYIGKPVPVIEIPSACAVFSSCFSH